jgi:hypothetical protein
MPGKSGFFESGMMLRKQDPVLDVVLVRLFITLAKYLTEQLKRRKGLF